MFVSVSRCKFQRRDEDCESIKMRIVELVDKCLYSSVAERQSCKLKVLGSIPSGGSCDVPQTNCDDRPSKSKAVSPIPNLHLLAGRNVGHSAQVSPTRNKCTPSMSEKSDVALLSSLCVRCSRGPMDKAKEEIAGSSPASSI